MSDLEQARERYRLHPTEANARECERLYRESQGSKEADSMSEREFRLDQIPCVREILDKGLPAEYSDERTYEEWRSDPGWVMCAAVNGGEKPGGSEPQALDEGYIPFSRRMRIQAWERVRWHVAELMDTTLDRADREDAEAMIAALDHLIAALKAPRPWPPDGRDLPRLWDVIKP